MELAQITYFMTLARVLNFTQAAAECGISQPALTRSIQRLETELGGELLSRERALTQLTGFGRVMLPLLERIDAAADLARSEARRMNGNERATLRLGISPWVAFPLLAPVLGEVVTAIQGTEFSLAVGGEEMLQERMLRGDLDLLVGFRSDVLPQQFERWSLFTSRVTVILPFDHLLAAEPAIPVERLAEAQFVGASEPESLPELILAILRQHTASGLASPHRANNWENSLQLTRAGLGLGLGLSCWPVPPELAARPLADPAMEHSIVLATVAGRRPSRAANAFVKLARARHWPSEARRS